MELRRGRSQSNLATMELLPQREARSFTSEEGLDGVSQLLATARETGSLDRRAVLPLGREVPLAALLRAATEVRARGKGRIVSCSKKVFIPLATLCPYYCRY